MAGRPRKAPNALAGHRAPRPALVSIAGGRADEPRPADERPVPPMPSPGSGQRWLAETERIWAGIWRSPMAENWNLDLHMPALYRWIRLQDQLIRAHRAVQRVPLVRGSKDQPRRNPIWDEIPKLEDMIRRLDDQLGLTPLAQVRMGLGLGSGTSKARTPAEIAAELERTEGWDWAAE